MGKCEPKINPSTEKSLGAVTTTEKSKLMATTVEKLLASVSNASEKCMSFNLPNLDDVNDSVTFTAGNLLTGDGTEWVDLALGTASQLLRVNAGGTAIEWATVSGTGDVTGPASATDEAIVRFNGTSGKIIQDYTGSAPTISDAGQLNMGGNAIDNVSLIDLNVGNAFSINSTDVLSFNTLGAGVVFSTLTTVGTITAGAWESSTDVGVAHGGTGASTAQAAIDTLTAVAGATNEHVLTKDTGTGNAVFKVAAGGGASLALDNLASVAINTTLVSDLHKTDDLGTDALHWKDIYMAGDLYNHMDTADGNPEFHIGSSLTEEFRVRVLYDSGFQTLESVDFISNVVSTDADKGEFRFYPDQSLVATVDDGGIELATAKSYYIDTSIVLSETSLGSSVVGSSLTSVGILTGLTMGGTVAMGANNITMTGSLGVTGARLTKGWFTDLEVTNAIAGSITGNAATVTTNANLTGEVTSTGNAAVIDPTAISGKGTVTPVSTDMLLLWDAGDSLLKKADAADFLAGSGTVTSSGSPLDNEIAVFSTATNIDSDSTFTWNAATSVFAVMGTTIDAGGVEIATGDTYAINAVDVLAATALHADVQVPVGSLNNGTAADATTFWRGDGAWITPGGSGDVVGDTASIDKELVRFNSTTGKIIESPRTDNVDVTATLSDGADLTLYDAGNNTDPEILLGANATDRLRVSTTYAATSNDLALVSFITDSSSAAAHAGQYIFNVDGTTILTINDDGLVIGGNIVMGDNSVTGIDTLTFTDTAGTIAGIQNQNLVDKADAESITGAWDFGGATTFEIPNSATPALGTTDGRIAIDTDLGAEWSHGFMKMYSGEELTVLAMPNANATGMTNNQVVTYDATNDELKFDTPAGGGDVSVDTGEFGSPANNELAVWTGTTTIEGDPDLSWNQTDFSIRNGDNDANPGIRIGASSLDEIRMETIYHSGTNDLDTVQFNAPSSSATADSGSFQFVVDETTRCNINDGGVDLPTGNAFLINDTSVLNNNTLGGGVTTSSLDTVATLTSGTWNADTITVAYGGTGIATATAYGVVCAGTTTTNPFQVLASLGSSGEVLTSGGPATLPTWTAAGSGDVTASGTPLDTEIAVFNTATEIDSDATFTWDGTTFTALGTTIDAGGVDIATGDTYAINGTDVISNTTTLGGTVVTSSLETVAIIGSGTWQGSVITDTYLQDTSLTQQGVVELATTAEIETGTDTTRAIPVDQFVASDRNIRFVNIRVVEAATDVAVDTTVGGDFECPFTGTIIQDDNNKSYFCAFTDTAGTTGDMIVDVHVAGATIMASNKLDIQTTHKSTSQHATTQPDVSDAPITAGEIITVDIDQIQTTAAKGLTVRIPIRLT